MDLSVKRVAAGAAAVVVGLIVLLVIAYLTGIIGLPNVAVKDPGDWGKSTNNSTQIVTTLKADNPNPIGISLSNGFSAKYHVSLNDVRLVNGERDAISIPKGTSTITLNSTLDNDKLVPWWVAFVRNNETIDLRATGSAHVSAIVGKDISFPSFERTILADKRPVVDSFSAAVASMEGNYTADAGLASAGYQIEDASAAWGEITRPTSNMTITMKIHNPGDVPVPLQPDGFTLNATGNGVPLFTAGRDALSMRNTGSDTLLQPGETRTVVYVVSMRNDHVDDWFVSHVRNDEQSQFVIKPRMRFAIPNSDASITIPPDGPGYRCHLQTGILVDDQQTETNCGSGGSAGA